MVFNDLTKVFLIGEDIGGNELTTATKLLLIMGIRPNNIFGGHCRGILSESEKKKRLLQLIQCDIALVYSSADRGVASRELEAAKVFGVPVLINMKDLKNELADYIIERYNKIIDVNIPLSVEHITGLPKVCLICPFFNECDNKSFDQTCRLSRARGELTAEKEEDQNESGDYENRD